MFDNALPRFGGVLAEAANLRVQHWQRSLARLHLSEGALALADELARIPEGLDAQDREDLTLLLLILLGEQARGCTFLALDDADRAQTYLDGLDRFKPGQQAPWNRLLAVLERPGLEAILGGPDADTPLVLEPNRLSSRRFHHSEATLAQAIQARLSPPDAPPAIPPRLLEAPDQLDQAQRAAVQLALSSPLALITGGPGTGKTTIVVAMLRALLHSGFTVDDILLAAPTGKAAQRMGQSIRGKLLMVKDRDAIDESLLNTLHEPETLHRLLGYLPSQGRFRHHAANVLAARVVVVDEASMIGQELMEALFLALPPHHPAQGDKPASGATLVLLGDPNQLPSVDAGQGVRDIVQALPADFHQHLETSHRMAGGGDHILKVAEAVNTGNLKTLWDGPNAIPQRASLADLKHEGVELVQPTAETLKAFLKAWMAKRIRTLKDGADLDTLLYPPLVAPAPGAKWSQPAIARIHAITDHLNRSRILCPVNAGPGLMGVDNLNDHLHDMALDHAKDQLTTRPRIIVGEPVMVQRNDYRRDLYNGDQGLVLMVQRGDTNQPEVFFPRGEGYASFPLAVMREELTLCYAMTVHRSQGSEFEQIALVLPEVEGEFLTRGILYTALTRAKRVVTILGEVKTLEAATGIKENRRSLLRALAGGG